MRRGKITLGEFELRRLLGMPDGLQVDFVYVTPDPPQVHVVLTAGDDDDRLPRHIERSEAPVIPAGVWMGWRVPPAEVAVGQAPLPGFTGVAPELAAGECGP